MLPKGWSQASLDKITKVIDCKHRTPIYVEDGIPLISPGTIKWGAIDLDSPSKKVTLKEYESLMDHCKVQIGDLVMSRNQSVGVASYINTNRPFVLGQDTVLIQPINAEPKFLFYSLQSLEIQRKIFKLAGGSTFSRINLTDIRKLQVSFPKYQEQQKIAQILSTWDKAIEKLEALIAAKQKRKKALMQQLLTGKKRFVGFDGDWKEYKLEDICQFKKGKGLSKEKLNSEGKFKCVLYGELYTKYKEVITNVISKTDDSDSVKSVFGDILIPSSTTTTGIDLANAVAILEDNVLLGGDINILRPNQKKACPEFLAYLLTHIKKHQIASRAQGITIIHLYGSDIKPIVVKLPRVEEQQKVASILFAADTEIEIHQKQLAALKEQKKGLMQQLLTGKKRVKINKQERLAELAEA